MTFSLLSLFQKMRVGLRPAPPSAPVRALPVDKPSTEKLSKTVMPNVVRTIAPADPFESAAGSLPARVAAASTMRNAPPGGRFGLPPVIALALKPKVERTISLELSDIVAEIPGGFVKPIETLDPSRRILLNASEIEKGMASGEPSISLATLYEQVPEIFLRSVQPTESTPVLLPYEKVLAQFSGARVRSDQQRDQNVPQVETPILQATIEDSARFGTTMEPLQTSALPAVKVEAASASALAAAEPESAVREKAPSPPRGRPTIPLSAPISSAPEPPRVETPGQISPTRIPFHLPPNGTGASASESVPASSGPPVPTRLPKPPTSPSPFKVRPPCDDLRPKLTLVPGVERREQVSSAPKSKPMPIPEGEMMVPVPLRLVLQNIPPFQLNGDASSVPEDVRVEIPLSIIQPQLASGRIAIDSKIFQAAMPENFRDLLVIDTSETAVLLPLQEVLKKLPTAALQMRGDQQEVDSGGSFETPFSIKAKEDAERFKTGEAPVAKQEQLPLIPSEAIESGAKPVVPGPDQGGIAMDKPVVRSPEQSEIELEPAAPAPVVPVKKEKLVEPDLFAAAAAQEKKLDAKEVVIRASALAGVSGCSVTFADGLILAGNLPAEIAVEGLCAMAPSLLQRIKNHMLDTNLGALNALTLQAEKSAFTFFMHGNICLAALHGDTTLAIETRTNLAEMTKELSRIYAQPEPAHVDH